MLKSKMPSNHGIDNRFGPSNTSFVYSEECM